MVRRRLALLLTLIAILTTLACLPTRAAWTLGSHSLVLHRGHASYVLVLIPPVARTPSEQEDLQGYMRGHMIGSLRNDKWFSYEYTSSERTMASLTDEITLASATIALQPVAIAAWLATLLMWILILRHQPKPGTCHQCGYDLNGNTSALCPECGAVTSCV